MRDRASLAPVKAHGYQKDLSNIPQFTTTSVHGRVSLALEYVQNSLLCTGISVPEGESIQALVLQVTGSFKDVGNENMPKTTILFSARCKVFAVSGASRSECNYLLKLHGEHAWRRRAVARFLKESSTLPVFKVCSNVERPRALEINLLY